MKAEKTWTEKVVVDEFQPPVALCRNKNGQYFMKNLLTEKGTKVSNADAAIWIIAQGHDTPPDLLPSRFSESERAYIMHHAQATTTYKGSNDEYRNEQTNND